MLSILLLLGFIFSIGLGVIFKIVKEGIAFSKDLPIYLDGIYNTIQNVKDKFSQYMNILPLTVNSLILDSIYKVKDLIPKIITTGLSSESVETLKSFPQGIMVFIIAIISCFLMLMDKKNIEEFIYKQIPKGLRKNIIIVKNGVFKALSGYVKAQFFMMLVTSTICTAGLLFLKLPYSLFLGLMIGFLDALPVFGSGFILWPWILYCFIVKKYNFVICLTIIYITILVVRQFLEPKILGKQIGIHPLITLMSIFIGLKAFGLFGFIIGPIIVVVIKALQDSSILPKWK